MSFRDSIRQLAHSVRAIPGQLGMRPYTVQVVSAVWSGAERGQGTETVTTTAITEADGQPPKVRQLNSEEIAVGGYAEGTWEIGPITPDFPGGGTLISTLQPDPADNTLVHIVLTGPAYPDGQRCQVKGVTDHRAFQYMLKVEQAAN